MKALKNIYSDIAFFRFITFYASYASRLKGGAAKADGEERGEGGEGKDPAEMFKKQSRKTSKD